MRRSDAAFRSPGHASAVALVDLFVEDGVLDLGPLGKYVGRAALIEACEKILPSQTVWSAHYITNPILHVNGSHATGSWVFLVYAQAAGTPPAAVTNYWGEYKDRYVKVGGVWRVAETVAVFSAPRS